MSAASVLARGRTAARALMVDTVLVRRRTGVTTDDMTGETTPAYTTIYTGPGRVQTSASGAMGNRTDSGEVGVVVLRQELQLPVVGSEGIRRGDEVSVTAATFDADLLGRVWTVRDLFHKTHGTARRLGLDEVT